MVAKTLEFRDGALWLLDQTQLPRQVVMRECRDYRAVAEAIRSLRVRGAPAIGLAAAYGAVLAAQALAAQGAAGSELRGKLDAAMDELGGTRPTAVNLFWALDRLRRAVAVAEASPTAVLAVLRREADRMLAEDEASNRAMGGFGADLIPDSANVLTHCNTGALATGAFGTALGVIRTAYEQGKRLHVWVDETRPLLQGARLTTWELQQLGIPFTLITDGMAGHFMARGHVDLAIVGADRIAANGDTANKIGTYSVAVLAQAHGIPFYVAAPTTTVDLSLSSGEQIPIEERKPEEITAVGETVIAPDHIGVANPAFDVTPAHLIRAIITESGIAYAPFSASLQRLVAASRKEKVGARDSG